MLKHGCAAGNEKRLETLDEDFTRNPYPLQFSLGALIHEAARHRRNVFDVVLKPIGTTRSQRWVLINLSQARGKGISQKELADRMQVKQVALGEKLSKMVESGHIERRSDPSDRRQKLLFITEKGSRLLNQSSKISKMTDAAIIGGISKSDIEIAKKVLSSMLNNLRRIEEDV